MHQALSKLALENLLSSVGDGAWLFDVERDTVRTSGALLKSLGYSDDELPRCFSQVMELFHPEDRVLIVEAFAALAEGRESRCNVQQRCRTKSGSWRWVHVQAGLISLSEVGTAPIILGITTDITEQKERELAAIEAEELVSQARTSAGAGIWDIDLASGEVTLCPLSLSMHDLPEDTGMPTSQSTWLSQLEEETAALAMEKFESAVTSGKNFSAEYQIKQTGRWILGSGKVLKDGSGKPVRFVGLNQDVTDLKTSKMMIAQMQNQLIHLSRVSAMGTMASTIAHELNQPLAAISLYSAAAKKMLGDTNDDLAGILQNINEASTRAGAVIRHMRAAIKRQDPVVEIVSLGELVNSAMELALLEARQEQVAVRAKVPKSFTVKGDRIQLEQVIVNLVRNAVEAMEGCQTKLLSISARKISGMVELRVADTGHGLSMEGSNSLFEPFETTKPAGMGIGLSICRTIIEAHGGRISAEPNDSTGAVFLITLPLTPNRGSASAPS